MSRLLKELIRKPSSSRFIATFTQQNPSNLPSSFLVNQSILGQTKFDHGSGLNPSKEGLTEIAHFNKLQIYPSFSFGYFIDPNLLSGSGPIGPETEHPGMMWADSVKKKRKKKMNKHKYKKLRKRLRRKTKT
ncbi:Mitochondrial mRNA-processing protein cox24 [Bienertia sinuspersici]